MKSEALDSLRLCRDDPEVLSDFVQPGFGTASQVTLRTSLLGRSTVLLRERRPWGSSARSWVRGDKFDAGGAGLQSSLPAGRSRQERALPVCISRRRARPSLVQIVLASQVGFLPFWVLFRARVDIPMVQS